jgi:hypothetical protein
VPLFLARHPRDHEERSMSARTFDGPVVCVSALTPTAGLNEVLNLRMVVGVCDYRTASACV